MKTPEKAKSKYQKTLFHQEIAPMANMSKATLSPEDRKTFFRLFLPLLDFTNQTFKISEELDEQLRMGCPDICELKAVADVLWKNTEIIDEYVKALQEKDKLSVEDVDLLKSWRHPVSGRFLLERHHSQGSVFIDTNTSEVY